LEIKRRVITLEDAVVNISAYRDLFPVTKKISYLNNAAESPLNNRVRERLAAYLTIAGNEPQKKPSVRTEVRKTLSSIFGGAADEYALVTSTGVGIGIVASGYKWRDGDNVVVPIDEHWNNTFPWLALRERGVDVRLAPLTEDQRIDPDTLAGLVDKNTRVLACAAVRFNTGYRSDLKLVSSIAHDKGALMMVDGIQGGGVCPLNVDDDGIDILACGGFKWLLGMPGTGLLYINRSAQEKIGAVLPGMFAAENHMRELHYHDDARRYETGTIAYSLFHAWTAGLEILQEIGIANIHARVIGLTDRLIAGLLAKGIEIISPVDSIDERSAIITFTLGSETANRQCHEKLMANNVLVALREGFIRVSPNFYNTEDEIDLLLDNL
jgi:cysteine desulfurase / selenocysteine lyase